MCKLNHDLLLSEPFWSALPLLGTMELPAETINGVTYPAEKLEQRNCPRCHSTLAKDVTS